ncbi:MAG: hybrid sensor histidine kinase/response regulator, partial [Bacteroidetes bacterium]|nr:hybrid sensor histidine kinase/response regulator [Bacteroidota bacterium]
IAEKGAKVTVDELPTINAVPGQMRQIFQNIISNSLKFMAADTKPAISISAETIDSYSTENNVLDKGPYCKISISDNGIGFDEAFLDKIFVIFQRLTTKEKHEGTGIGLAIAKKIVDKHKGAITASSKQNQGATFVIVLPLSNN